MTLYQSRTYSLLGIVLSVFTSVACAAATLGAVRDGSLLGILYAGVGALVGFVGYDYIKRLRNPPPLAIFTALGVTNEYGQSFKWSQITKVYKLTGVLFMRDASKAGWVIRLDPAEVGCAQLSEAIVFVKSHAPTHLTDRL